MKAFHGRKFKVWQTYKESKPIEVETDYAIHAAESYTELNCISRDTSVYFAGQHNNNTKKFHNNEIGTVYVTEQ